MFSIRAPQSPLLLVFLTPIGCAKDSSSDSSDSGIVDDTDKDDDGFSDEDGDCNDNDADVFPGAEDSYGDSVDQALAMASMGWMAISGRLGKLRERRRGLQRLGPQDQPS